MTKEIKKETPFEYLTHKDGKAFSRETINHWYIARAYVLDKLKNYVFAPNDYGHLHVVVTDDSPLMLAVVRQVALSAHYVNYIEYDVYGKLACTNRTVITLVSQKENIVSELKKEEYLCNLLDYCKYSVNGMEENKDSYIDIELQIVKELSKSDMPNTVLMTEEDVQAFLKTKKDEDIYKIDTRSAVYASRMYNLGDVIGNLPAEDIHCAKRYTQALGKFQHVQMPKKITPLIDDEKRGGNLTKVKESLSNLFCADCFESRNKGIEKWREKEQKKSDEKVKTEDAWEKFNMALSQSEHERWVVEKLIMGYRPYSDQERFQYESLFGEERKAFRKKLKNNASDPAHVDLCSYHDLRRISPDDLKYDSFLMLAIPKILERVRHAI